MNNPVFFVDDEPHIRDAVSQALLTIYCSMIGKLLVALPVNVVGGIANAKHRVEQQVHLSRTATNDELLHHRGDWLAARATAWRC